MKHLFVILLILASIYSNAQNQRNPIGAWREQNSFDSVVNIIEGDQIYITNGAEILVVPSNTFHIGKSTGLHNASIKKIVWNKYNQSIISIYNNSQIDIIKGDQINAINDIYNTTLYPHKNINDVFVTDFNKAMVSTDFGIVMLDLIDFTIADTWFPNNTRSQEITYAAFIKNDTLFALTKNGLQYNILQNHQINNYWVATNQFKGCNKMVDVNGTIWIASNNEIFKFPSNVSRYHITNGNLFKLISTNNQLYVIVKNYIGNGYYKNLRTETPNIIADSSMGFQPLDILEANKQLYIASNNKGYQALASSSIPQLPGPVHPLSLETIGFDDQIFTNFTKNNTRFSTYNEVDGWQFIPYMVVNNVDHYNQIAYQSTTNKVWLSTTNTIKSWDISNQQLSTIPFDSSNGTIVKMHSNSIGDIWLMHNKGFANWNGTTWNNFSPSNSLNTGLIKDFIVNDLGQLWIIPKNNQGLYVYQTKKYFTNEIVQQLTTNSASGNLPSNNVVAVCADKKGSIWIGTDNGIGILYPDDISKNIPKAYLPIIHNNGFNGYLLQKEKIHCIQANGANQKWVGTDNGAWLISSDGNEIIEHLTTTNSKLQNDTVLQITIIPTTGEVFFISNQQASSYKSIATEPSSHLNAISIFPNPVPPNFGGLITIRNLVENAMVKITDLEGKLVYQTRSQGGTAVWNGITYLGNKPSTGIYLVWIRDNEGNEKAVGKILFTSGVN